MTPSINTYECKLTSKDSVAEKWLDVSYRLDYCLPDDLFSGEIKITSLGYEILIQKIIFLLREDLTSRVFNKTLHLSESLSIATDLPALQGCDKMIIVTNEGDFLFCCDEQAEYERDFLFYCRCFNDC